MSSKSAGTGTQEASDPVRWLHLSDLHLGCPGRELWWEMQTEFRDSIRAGVERIGVPELILITGDLTSTGAGDEFRLVDEFLDQLLGWIREAGDGPEPLIIPIPGNHDLVRPKGFKEASRFLILEKYGEGNDNDFVKELIADLWEKRHASFLKPLFAPYLAWLKRRILPQRKLPGVTVNVSHFPGDLTFYLDLAGRIPLAVVGLNSTWMQYQAGDFEGQLELPTAQFHAALDRRTKGSPLAELEATERALLLMHHPPSWLSPRAQDEFRGTIYKPELFVACLHGHLHKARSKGLSLAGGPPRYYFQAPSLFGLEHYGTSRERHAFGYAWGRISETGQVRLWPRVRTVRGDGTAAFVHDTFFYGNEPDGSQMRPADSVTLLEPEPSPTPARQCPRRLPPLGPRAASRLADDRRRRRGAAAASRRGLRAAQDLAATAPSRPRRARG